MRMSEAVLLFCETLAEPVDRQPKTNNAQSPIPQIINFTLALIWRLHTLFSIYYFLFSISQGDFARRNFFFNQK
jgi:hypothetical protein